MTDRDQRAFVARVSRHDPGGTNRRRTVFYAVLAGSKDAALSAVAEAVAADDYVEITDGKLSSGTARALGLVPGVPKAM